jgi:glycosyltransferase involved in cell wall biosynthesis
MNDEQLFISVIIPTIGRKSIDQCLESLKSQSRKPDEIIVLKDEHKRGAAYVRNRAIEKAKGSLIAFTDDDCILPKNWLESLLTILVEYKADAVGGTMTELDPFLNEMRLRRNFPENVQVDVEGWVGDTANVMYTKAILDHCRAKDGIVFNEFYQRSSDIDLAWRVAYHGGKIIYSPIKVSHLKTVSWKTFLSYQFKRGMGLANLSRSNQFRKGLSTHQASLILGEQKNTLSKWFNLIVFRVIGPFDWKSFSKWQYFIQFWVGEKIKAVGYIYQKIRG